MAKSHLVFASSLRPVASRRRTDHGLSRAERHQDAAAGHRQPSAA